MLNIMKASGVLTECIEIACLLRAFEQITKQCLDKRRVFFALLLICQRKYRKMGSEVIFDYCHEQEP